MDHPLLRPVLVPDPRDGRPTTAWDRAWEAANGSPVPQDQRSVPSLGTWCLTPRKTIHEHARALPGRPLRFTLEEATAIKNAYWTGLQTAAELARQYSVTRLTISRIVHGKTYWWA